MHTKLGQVTGPNVTGIVDYLNAAHATGASNSGICPHSPLCGLGTKRGLPAQRTVNLPTSSEAKSHTQVLLHHGRVLFKPLGAHGAFGKIVLHQ
jgi:hypothetical protein